MAANQWRGTVPSMALNLNRLDSNGERIICFDVGIICSGEGEAGGWKLFVNGLVTSFVALEPAMLLVLRSVSVEPDLVITMAWGFL